MFSEELIMAKYSKAAQEKIGQVMDEWKQGDLKSSNGQPVKSQKQAVAIGISEARRDGKKVPKDSK
jgi:lysyl-tRNA synthetase class II